MANIWLVDSTKYPELTNIKKELAWKNKGIHERMRQRKRDDDYKEILKEFKIRRIR